MTDISFHNIGQSFCFQPSHTVPGLISNFAVNDTTISSIIVVWTASVMTITEYKVCTVCDMYRMLHIGMYGS